jgi:hypothetical protein
MNNFDLRRYLTENKLTTNSSRIDLSNLKVGDILDQFEDGIVVGITKKGNFTQLTMRDGEEGWHEYVDVNGNPVSDERREELEDLFYERPIKEEEAKKDKKLTYNDFVQMVRDDMMAGSSPDEYPSDEQVRRRAESYYNDYLQGASVDDLFEATKEDEEDPYGGVFINGITGYVDRNYDADLAKAITAFFTTAFPNQKEISSMDLEDVVKVFEHLYRIFDQRV